MAKQRRGRAPTSEVGPDQIDVEVGLNLRRLRLSRGLSQTELGEALGISFQQIQKYERGANRVSASMLVKAARFLNVAAADILPSEDQQRPTPHLAPRLSEVRGVVELANAYCAIDNPVVRRAVLRFVRAMAQKGASALASADEEKAFDAL